jgi:hypothetical protein
VFSGKDSIFDPVRRYNNIQYPDEDDDVRETFEAELEKRGIPSQMPEQAYQDPDFTFDQNYEQMAKEEGLKVDDD